MDPTDPDQMQGYTYANNNPGFPFRPHRTRHRYRQVRRSKKHLLRIE